MSSKFLTESTGEKNVKICQYLTKIWTKYDSLVFWATLYANNNCSNVLTKPVICQHGNFRGRGHVPGPEMEMGHLS